MQNPNKSLVLTVLSSALVLTNCGPVHQPSAGSSLQAAAPARADLALQAASIEARTAALQIFIQVAVASDQSPEFKSQLTAALKQYQGEENGPARNRSILLVVGHAFLASGTAASLGAGTSAVLKNFHQANKFAVLGAMSSFVGVRSLLATPHMYRHELRLQPERLAAAKARIAAWTSAELSAYSTYAAKVLDLDAAGRTQLHEAIVNQAVAQMLETRTPQYRPDLAAALQQTQVGKPELVKALTKLQDIARDDWHGAAVRARPMTRPELLAELQSLRSFQNCLRKLAQTASPGAKFHLDALSGKINRVSTVIEMLITLDHPS